MTSGFQKRLSGEAASLVERVRARLRRAKVAAAGDAIVVAVSGGVDSMVLLDVLHRLAPAFGWKLVVAHFNHQLRGSSSAADERLVSRTARAFGCVVEIGRGDVRKYAKAHGLSIEMAARDLRHAFLVRAARKHRAHLIATAHHANDQIELFFLRLLRGTGVPGLAGMRFSSPSPADSSLRVVRPLLSISRTALESYANDRKLRFREDATNQSTDFLRNRIRLELLPLLRKQYQPGIEATIGRIMETLASESDFVEAAATEWLRRRKPAFDRLHTALQRRCIHRQCVERGIDPDFDLVEKLRANPGKRVSVADIDPGELLLTPEGLLESAKPEPPVSSHVLQVDLEPDSGTLEFAGMRVQWKLFDKEGSRLIWKKHCEYFDADSVGRCIRLRHWRPADRFQPIGMAAPVKLQDLFTNAKIPRALRSSLVVAEDETGRIFWVEKLRISEQHKVLSDTRRGLRWTWKPLNPNVATVSE